MVLDHDGPDDDLTVLESTDAFIAQGYSAQFAAADGAMVRCFSCHAETPAAEFVIDALDRSEGASDPDDMVANVAAQCPSCKAKGILTLKYGADASEQDQLVLKALDDRRFSSRPS
jgi:hypothetical protein